MDKQIFETLQLLWPKLLVALLCGGLIGLERELKSKAAGIKTNMLICVGATLYTAISIMVATYDGGGGGFKSDPARIAAQIVSGVGFLGGGAVLQSKGNIVGLTTAATIWLVAALGVWIGMGHLVVAICVTVMIVVVLVSVNFLENQFLGRKRLFRITIHLREKSDEVTRAAIEGLMNDHEINLEDYREIMSGEQPEIRLSYVGRKSDHSGMLLDLWKIRGILDVKQM